MQRAPAERAVSEPRADAGTREGDRQGWERAPNFQFQKAQPRNQKDRDPGAVVSLCLTKEHSCYFY